MKHDFPKHRSDTITRQNIADMMAVYAKAERPPPTDAATIADFIIGNAGHHTRVEQRHVRRVLVLT